MPAFPLRWVTTIIHPSELGNTASRATESHGRARGDGPALVFATRAPVPGRVGLGVAVEQEDGRPGPAADEVNGAPGGRHRLAGEAVEHALRGCEKIAGRSTRPRGSASPRPWIIASRPRRSTANRG